MNSDKDNKMNKKTEIHKAYKPNPWTIRLPDAPEAYRQEVARLARNKHMCVGSYLTSLLDEAIKRDNSPYQVR